MGEEKIELIIVLFLPQLSYQCLWQLLHEDKWKEQGANPKGERTIVRKQTIKLNWKVANKIFSPCQQSGL